MKKIAWKSPRKVKFNTVNCRLAFGNYYDGKPRLVLKEIRSDVVVAVATINNARDGVYASSINKEIVIKSWGTNDGMYETLRDYGIISRSKDKISVGLNEAHVCELLVDPHEYETLE